MVPVVPKWLLLDSYGHWDTTQRSLQQLVTMSLFSSVPTIQWEQRQGGAAQPGKEDRIQWQRLPLSVPPSRPYPCIPTQFRPLPVIPCPNPGASYLLGAINRFYGMFAAPSVGGTYANSATELRIGLLVLSIWTLACSLVA